ncbi:MAG: MaoC family dehydratase [Oscillospiraceae bacterium]|nr:MaoC family dehydratase [Oscillospiraceae bacterium]
MKNYEIGQQAQMTRTISESDVYLFAGITGDLNPAHINEPYARGTRFGRRIAHGMLTAGLISAVLGTRLPGAGTIYLSQTLKFLSPVYIGDTITARVEILRLEREGKGAVLKTEAVNQDGRLVATGEAAVLLPEE